MLLSRFCAAEDESLLQSSSDSLFIMGRVAELSYVFSREFIFMSAPDPLNVSMLGIGVAMCCDGLDSSWRPRFVL